MIIFVAVLIIAFCSIYRFEIRAMDKTAGSSTFVVEKGDTWYSIGNKLYDGKFVRSYILNYLDLKMLKLVVI